MKGMGVIYRNKNDGSEYVITNIEDEINSCILYDSMKWYEYYDDMKNMSQNFPEVIFHLEGDGEDPDDLWVADFMNGVGQIRNATIPPFEKEYFCNFIDRELAKN